MMCTSSREGEKWVLYKFFKAALSFDYHIANEPHSLTPPHVWHLVTSFGLLRHPVHLPH